MICIIPARGGSKRIKRKNIRAFRGDPIISYPIAMAQVMGYDTYVSTDDQEIADISRDWGAEVIYRPPHLADDNTELEEVLYDLFLGRFADEAEALMILPTSVFASINHLEAARDLLSTAQVVYSVVEYEYPPQRAVRFEGDYVVMDIKEYRNTQDIPRLYHDAGQYYFFNVAAFIDGWERGLRLLDLRAKAIIYEAHEVQDIDTLNDWVIAEMKYERSTE